MVAKTDVLDRYYKAAKYYKANTVVRITGDCPSGSKNCRRCNPKIQKKKK